MLERYFYRSQTSHRWPLVDDRMDYVAGHYDGRSLYVASAYFVALAGGQPGWFPGVGETRTVEEGWWFGLDLGEHEYQFRVVLNVPLTSEEESCCIARGRWPLLRVPLGVLMIGTHPFWERTAQFEVLGGEEVITVPWCESYAVVLVPPGNYEVEIREYLTGNWDGPSLVFHLTRTDKEPPCPDTMSLRPAKSLPPEIEALVNRFVSLPFPEFNTSGVNVKRACLSIDVIDGFYPGARDRCRRWTELRLPPLDDYCVDGIMQSRKHRNRKGESGRRRELEQPHLHVRTFVE